MLLLRLWFLALCCASLGALALTMWSPEDLREQSPCLAAGSEQLIDATKT